jgi:hypothetical protein
MSHIDGVDCACVLKGYQYIKSAIIFAWINYEIEPKNGNRALNK